MSRMWIGFLAVAALIGVSAAAAKDFEPADLRICNDRRCLAIMDRDVLRGFGSFYYGDSPPRIVPARGRGAPAVEVRFKNGYAAGTIGGARLDHALVYGLNCGRFRRGIWYRLPMRVAAEVRRLASRLKPLRRTPATVPRSC